MLPKQKPDTTPIRTNSPISQLLVFCVNCRVEKLGKEIMDLSVKGGGQVQSQALIEGKQREIRRLTSFLEDQKILTLPFGSKIEPGMLVKKTSNFIPWLYLFEWKVPPIGVLQSLDLEKLGITIIPIGSNLGKAFTERNPNGSVYFEGVHSIIKVYTQPEAKAFIQGKFNPTNSALATTPQGIVNQQRATSAQ